MDDHSSLSVKLHGIRTTESMLLFRLGGHALVSYEDTLNAHRESYQGVPNRADTVVSAFVLSLKKDGTDAIKNTLCDFYTPR